MVLILKIPVKPNEKGYIKYHCHREKNCLKMVNTVQCLHLQLKDTDLAQNKPPYC